MSLSVDSLSLFLIITLAQGFFILSVLTIKYQLMPGQHLFLFFMVLVLIWFQAEFLSVRLPYDIRVNAFYGTRYGAWFILGPLFYFYVRSIVGNPFVFSMRDVLHFVPFVIFVWIIPLFTSEFLSFRQVHYGMLSTFDPFDESVTFLQYTYSTVFIAQFFHFLIYLAVAFSIIRQYERNLKGNYSSLNSTNIRWLKTVNVLLLIVLALASLFLVLFFMRRSYNRDLDYLYVFPMAILIYLVGYKLAGVQWPLASVYAGNRNKYEKSSLKVDQAKAYCAQLEQFVAHTKPYLSNELRLQELAEMVNIPSHHLSQVINEQLRSTFFDYINRHRVEEAKKQILADKDSTLLEIAFKAGFNNKTSFTNAFKKFTSKTPAEFKRQHTVG